MATRERTAEINEDVADAFDASGLRCSRQQQAQDGFVVDFRIVDSFAIFASVVCFSIASMRSYASSKWSGSLILGGALTSGLGSWLTSSVALMGLVISAVGCITLGQHRLRPVTTGCTLKAQAVSGSIPCNSLAKQGHSAAT